MNSLPSTLSRLTLVAGLLMLAAAGQAQPVGLCGTWEPVPSPSPGSYGNGLYGITALSADEAWAIGSQSTGPSQYEDAPLVVRWDGAAWQEVPVPGVGSTPGGDVWAVGSEYVWTMLTSPRVLRYRDGAFVESYAPVLRKQTVYPYWDRSGYPNDADGTGPDDVWVVGEASGFGDALATTVGMALHWDGATWTDVDVPRLGTRTHYINGVVALAPDDVWIVGYYRSIADLYRAVTYHWDGTAWTHVPNPAEALPEETFLYDVDALAPDDVWAVGKRLGAALFMHWDGTSWTMVDSPVSQSTWVDEVAMIASDDAWAVGTLSTDSFFHWDGTAWTEVPVASPPSAVSFSRSGGLAVVGPCDVWSVGAYNDGTSGYTFVERLQPDRAVSVGVAPVGGPVVIGPGGGSFQFELTLTNHAAQPQTVEVWTEAHGPVHRAPVLGPQTVTLPAGATVTRTLTQGVPAAAPAGTYNYVAALGAFPDAATSGAFPVTKQPGAGRTAAGVGAAEWTVSGWDGAAGASVALSDGFALSAAHPNPSRAHASLTLALDAAQAVRVEVYDALGHRVAVLHDGALEPGAHAFTLDASALASGVYAFRVTGETFAATRRVTLVR